MIRPRSATLVIAGLASLAIVLVAGIAVWRHLGGVPGDDLTIRSAVTTPVDEAVAKAAAHSTACAEGLSNLASADNDANASALESEMAGCGAIARDLAERGYSTLDAVAGSADTGSTPGRDAYLDAAGSLLSVYEMQGDDFDMIFDMLERARSDGAPMQGDITSILSDGLPDITAGQKELARARDSYRAKG